MGDIRVLYTDVDGTLVGPGGSLFASGDGGVTVEAAEAVVAAAEAGLEIVPLSGRSRPFVEELARLIGAASWIGELGALRSYRRGEVVVVDHGRYRGPGTPMEDLRRAAAGLMEAFPGRIEEHSPWNGYREASFLLRGDVVLTAAREWLDEHGFGWADVVDNGVIPRRYETLPEVATVRAYHLTPMGVSKHAAVAADRAYRGLGPEECAVIGDSAADLACHAEVARCFVVANALEKDPEITALVTATPNAEITKRGYGQGFADVVAELLGTR